MLIAKAIHGIQKLAESINLMANPYLPESEDLCGYPYVQVFANETPIRCFCFVNQLDMFVTKKSYPDGDYLEFKIDWVAYPEDARRREKAMVMLAEIFTYKE